jgi:hypothetical protein
MKFLKLIVLLFIPLLSQSQIVINELDCDTPSTDDREFIELKSTTPNFPLDGYVLVLFNGTGTQANLSYYVIDLDGYITDVNGIFVIGNALVSPVPGKFLPDNIFQNGPDGVGLYLGSSSDFPNLTQATTNNLIDALVYDTSDPDVPTLMGLLGQTIQWNENVNNLQTSQSLQRKNDGTFEAKLPTPGANNDGSGFIFNGLNIVVGATQYNEGQSFNITIISQTNVTSDASFSINLDNGTFTTADFTGNLNLTILSGTNTVTTTINLVDDVLDEGDEIAKIKFVSVPTGFNKLNDNIQIRIIDNDYYVSPFGTPLNPTFGNVTSTAPAGYYDSIEGLAGNALKQALQNIIADTNVVHAHNYGDIIEILKHADQNPLNSNEVWLMYVEQPRTKLDFQETGGSNFGKWNREHIYPQSRGGFADGTSSTPDGIDIWLPTNADDLLAGHADAHHIRAEDGPENSLRSNKDYGLTGYNGPTGNQSSWKGDVARSLFYMAVRYNALSLANGDLPDSTVGQLGDLATLLQWNYLDPRDDFEMNRNNYVYTWQVNRNPFIDYPNLADYIYGANFGQPWFSTLSNTNFNTDKVVLYPNPVHNQFSVFGLNTESKIEIYNGLGSKVFEENFNGEKMFNINLSTGIYFAKITSENSQIIKKIIVE